MAFCWLETVDRGLTGVQLGFSTTRTVFASGGGSHSQQHHASPSNHRWSEPHTGQGVSRLTVASAFRLVLSAQEHSLADLRGMLPHEAQYRFDPDPETPKAQITARLDSFD
jgi:hypothetical protein